MDIKLTRNRVSMGPEKVLDATWDDCQSFLNKLDGMEFLECTIQRNLNDGMVITGGHNGRFIVQVFSGSKFWELENLTDFSGQDPLAVHFHGDPDFPPKMLASRATMEKLVNYYFNDTTGPGLDPSATWNPPLQS
jgi:hypothetical protein